MAFKNTVLSESAKLGAGEVVKSKPYVTEAFATFEDGLIQGRFAKYDTGSLDNLDGSATPTIAGIVRRKIGGELGVSTYRSTGTLVDTVAEAHTMGFATVDVVASLTPARYGTVYAENQTAGEYGKATTVSTDNVATNWVFIEEIDTDVWLVARKEMV